MAIKFDLISYTMCLYCCILVFEQHLQWVAEKNHENDKCREHRTVPLSYAAVSSHSCCRCVLFLNITPLLFISGRFASLRGASFCCKLTLTNRFNDLADNQIDMWLKRRRIMHCTCMSQKLCAPLIRQRSQRSAVVIEATSQQRQSGKRRHTQWTQTTSQMTCLN